MAVALYDIQLLRACSAVLLFPYLSLEFSGLTQVVVDRSGASFPTAIYGAKNLPVIYWDVIPRRIKRIVLLGAQIQVISRASPAGPCKGLKGF